jgi:Tfp pilus assembly protein PilO
MIGNLSRRERMLILGSVAVVLVVGGWSLVVQPIREQNQVVAELLPTRQQVLARRQDLIARKAAITQELATLGTRIDAATARFLTSAAPPVAASELQKIAKDMAAAATMEVRSERILSPVERGEILEIPVEIAVSGDIRNLVDLLARLDGTQKLVTVQDLKIRVMNIAQPKELLATITLSGYIIQGRART